MIECVKTLGRIRSWYCREKTFSGFILPSFLSLLVLGSVDLAILIPTWRDARCEKITRISSSSST